MQTPLLTPAYVRFNPPAKADSVEDQKVYLDSLAGQYYNPPAAAPALNGDQITQKLMSQMGDRVPLPPSPCLKHTRTGQLYVWTAPLATQGGDCLVNCDERGNEDPNTWRGRYPAGMNIPPQQPALGAAGNEPGPAPSPSAADTLQPPPAEGPARTTRRRGRPKASAPAGEIPFYRQLPDTLRSALRAAGDSDEAD